MSERQRLILMTAATVAARAEPDHIGHEHHGNGGGIAYSTPEYPPPEQVAERSIEIAECLIAAVYPVPAISKTETGEPVDEGWEESPESHGWYWFCGRYTKEHELMFEVVEVIVSHMVLDDEPYVIVHEGRQEKISTEGRWIGKWKHVTEPEPPIDDTEMREHMGYQTEPETAPGKATT